MCWSKGHVWITISVGSLSHGHQDLGFTMEDLWQPDRAAQRWRVPPSQACRVAGNGPGCHIGEPGVSSRLSLWCWECSSLFVCLVYFEEQRVLNFAAVHSIDIFSALIVTMGFVSDSRKRIWQPDLCSSCTAHSYRNTGNCKNHQPGKLHRGTSESFTGNDVKAGSVD